MLMTVVLVVLVFLAQPAWAQPRRDLKKRKEIRALLAKVVAKEKIPGMVAAIADTKGIVAIGSAGIRKAGSDSRMVDGDLVHIGSCTKAMTCLMLATLVADGTLTWETKLIEVFPELKDEVHSDYHQATLWQLVSHRAGVTANASDWWVHRRKEIRQRRLAILKENLKEAAEVEPGEFHYSNLGYMIAGCMAEKRCGATWEALMNNRVFKPLGMTRAGFGPPGNPQQVDQPWGHVKSDGKWQPKHFDNAEALGPAGRVHCTLADWAKFVALQMPGSKKLLARLHLDKLIEPNEGDYAGGWIVVQRPWAKGLALTHSGSNTMWYATVWVAPKLNRAYLVATNSSGENSHSICDNVIATLIGIDRGGTN